MNGTKSANLIMNVYNLKQHGKHVLVFKSSLDTRDSGIVKSRALPTTLKADVVRQNMNGYMYKRAKDELPKFVYVDEVQFMTKEQIEELSDIVDLLGINVICYGLLTDYRSQLFEGSKRLIELADSIREIKNQCQFCNNKATQNMLFENDIPVFEGNPIRIGDTEYKHVCRKCYKHIKTLFREVM
jgi:thymidine kinase